MSRGRLLILTEIIIGLLSVAGTPVRSQEPSPWLHSTNDDPLHAKVNDEFVLSGKYLTRPEHAHYATPSIVVICAEGKLKQSYINVGAVVTMEGHSNLVAALEARMDGKKKSILSTGESTDGTGVFFSRVDLRNMLRAHQVVIGVNEYLGPEVVMQFDMPDPSPVFATCEKDRILKQK